MENSSDHLAALKRVLVSSSRSISSRDNCVSRSASLRSNLNYGGSGGALQVIQNVRGSDTQVGPKDSVGFGDTGGLGYGGECAT